MGTHSAVATGVLLEREADSAAFSVENPDIYQDSVGAVAADPECLLPTTPCSVVWSGGHSYVLESLGCRCRWAGVDDRGRPRFLSDADLYRRGWSYTRG